MNRNLELKEAVRMVLGDASGSEEDLKEAEHIVRLRIRTVLQQLVDAKEDQSIQTLCRGNYFGRKELDTLISYAIEQRNEYMCICLIRLKAEKYGFHDREWTI